jgi:phosphoglycerate dehydrogenase-like enzyme
MSDCVIVQPIHPAGVALLRAAGLSVAEAPAPDLDTLRPLLAEARAVITRNAGFSAAAMAAAPGLRVISSHGTGTDAIDRAEAARRGIQVCNTPGANARAVAEHALALILAAAKLLPQAEAALRAGDFGYRDRHATTELAGRTLGLVGFGHVARLLAAMGACLGMRVLVASAHAGAAELAALGAAAADLDRICAEADVLSLHAVPRGAPLFDAARLARLRPGAILVNTARGALVDEAALARALHDGRLGAAALDVFRHEPLPQDSPLLAAPNLILTPHMAGSAEAAQRRTAEAAARNVLAALAAPR